MGGLLVLADGTAEADAERAFKVASKAAEAAVSKAVQAAAAAGLEYRPPPDMQLDTPRVPKVTSPYTEDRWLYTSADDSKRRHTCEHLLVLLEFSGTMLSVSTCVCNFYISAAAICM